MSDDRASTVADRQIAWSNHLRLGQGDRQGFEPGPFVVSYLARAVDPADVLLAEWSQADEPESGMSIRSGSITALLIGYALEFNYTNVPAEKHAWQYVKPRVELVFRPITEEPTVIQHTSMIHPETKGSEADAIVIQVGDWAMSYPGGPRHNESSAAVLNQVRAAAAASVRTNAVQA